MFHANGWTFTWIVTAAGGTHVCLRQGRAEARLRADRARVDHDVLRRADRAHRARQRARRRPAQARSETRVFTAGAPPAAATIGRIEGELGWEITHVYGLTETAPFITICEPLPAHAALSPEERATVKASQGVELITSGERARRRRGRPRGPPRRPDARRDRRRGNVVMKGYYNDPEATAKGFAAAGSTPATPRSSIRTATSRSAIASRT